MADEKIIYAITTGEYSDYRICALTTDKKRAEYLKRYYSTSIDHANIEEFIDGAPDIGIPELNKVFFIRRVGHGREYVWESPYYYYTSDPKYENRFYNLLIDDHYQNPGFTAYISAKDVDHAIKIAQDEFAKQMAEYLGL